MDKKEKFIKKAKNKFGDKFNYSEIEYINSSKNIKIKCNFHNIYFSQQPSEHLRGKNGCHLCTNKPKVTTEYFINKAKSIHGDRYDYSMVNYINSYTKVNIVCKKHGMYSVLPNNHYIQNCPNCYNDNRSITSDEFIENVNKIHSGKYDYSLVDYKNTKEKIKIICKEHGEFEQVANDHVCSKGCPKCGNKYNQLEGELKDFISTLGIEYHENTKKVIPPLEIDIYLPLNKTAFEFNGLYWHSEIYKEKNYHLNKTNECNSKGVKLIQIFEDEWLFKKDIVKSRIKNIVGITENKIYARKCIMKEVSFNDSKIFLENNHIQGNINSKVNIGLYYNNELVSIMTFGSLRKSMGSLNEKNCYELLRFCNKINNVVIGGASKLLKYFIKKYTPHKIISYADKRWSEGNLYKMLGFNYVHDSKPNYFYVNGLKREHRFNFRKDKLVKNGFDKQKTEHQIMKDRGYHRIYDCGCKKYEIVIK